MKNRESNRTGAFSGQQEEWIRLDMLRVVWNDAQRPIRPTEVERIAVAFDPDFFDMPHVSPPLVFAGGVHHIIDGQNRIEAARKALGSDQKIKCTVHASATNAARAATIFRAINGQRSKPHAVDNFRMAVTAGEEVEVRINDLLNGLGLEVGRGGDNAVFAVESCRTVYNKFGPDILRDAIVTLRHIWPGDGVALEGPMIHGFAMFLAEHGERVKPAEMRKRLAKKFTSTRFVAEAKALRHVVRGGKMASAVSLVVSTSMGMVGRDSERRAA